MNDIAGAVDLTQVPTLIALIALFVSRAWKSRELTSLRNMLETKEEQVFELEQANRRYKRRLKLATRQLEEYENAAHGLPALYIESEED